MQRRLIQHGDSSLGITLPSDWCRQRKLKKGAFIDLDKNGNGFTISADGCQLLERVIIDITALDAASLRSYIRSKYRIGFNEIEVRFKNQTAMHYRIGKEEAIQTLIYCEVNRLVGAEIIEQGQNYCVIKYISSDNCHDFEIILRRIFMMLLEANNALLSGVEKQDKNILETMEERHDIVTKFISYCLRFLNKNGYTDTIKANYYFCTISSLDEYVDLLKDSARMLLNEKVDKEGILLMKKILNAFELFYGLFYKFNLKTIEDLSKTRTQVIQEISVLAKKPKKQVVALTKMEHMLELIMAMAAAKMGQE